MFALFLNVPCNATELKLSLQLCSGKQQLVRRRQLKKWWEIKSAQSETWINTLRTILSIVSILTAAAVGSTQQSGCLFPLFSFRFFYSQKWIDESDWIQTLQTFVCTAVQYFQPLHVIYFKFTALVWTCESWSPCVNSFWLLLSKV